MRIITFAILILSAVMAIMLPRQFYAHTTARRVNQNETMWRLRYENYTLIANNDDKMYLIAHQCMKWEVPYTPVYSWMNGARIGAECQIGRNYGKWIYPDNRGNNFSACVIINDEVILPLQIRMNIIEDVITFIGGPYEYYWLKC